MKRTILIFIFFLTGLSSLTAQKLCDGKNFAFKSGEELEYKVYYNVSFVYVGAGKVTFTTRLVQHKNRPAWHVVGKGRTFSSYDWFFKVRDQYESYIDTSNMQPLTFIRDVHEGDYTKYNKVSFDHEKGIATSKNGTYNTPKCIQDVISGIYHARNIGFN